MPDQPNSNSSRPLSEISHLFLSSIREKAGNGAAAPRRRPPVSQATDLTPEEFAQVSREDSTEADRGPARVPQVTAVIGAHLNGRQFDRAKEYARHLAAGGGRVGLIEVDASEFRVMCFDPSGEDRPQQPEAEC